MSTKILGEIDKSLLYSLIILTVVGFVALASASAAESQVEYGHPYYFVLRQLAFGLGGGAILALFFFVIPHKTLRLLAPVMFFGALGAMLLVFIPGLGIGAGGAHRWVSIGPLSVQPSEFLKLAVVLYIAAWLANRKDATKTISQGYLPFLGIMGIIGAFLIFQPDISTLGVLSFTALAMYFVAGARLEFIGATIGLGIAALLVLIRLAPYRVNRILAFLNPGADPLGIGWQVNQATLAVGSGGLWGRGLGFSREKLFWLPEAFGDAIFAVFAEETGFVGSVLIILLFLFFAWRGIRIALSLPDDFLRFLAFGITFLIMIQAFLNIGGVLGLLPLMGITLPFVSYGSSSLAVTIGACALLLSLSRITSKRARKSSL